MPKANKRARKQAVTVETIAQTIANETGETVETSSGSILPETDTSTDMLGAIVNDATDETATESDAAVIADDENRADASDLVSDEQPTVNAEPAAPSKADNRRLARSVAASAVAAFYHGKSLPFKSSADLFKPLNFDNAKSATERQAALLLALYTYGADNIAADGTFIRGNFRVPASLVFDAETMRKLGLAADETISAQPESGCLGNMLNRCVYYVSGPTSGREQRNTVLRIDHAKARAEIQAHFRDSGASIVDAHLAALAAATASESETAS